MLPAWEMPDDSSRARHRVRVDLKGVGQNFQDHPPVRRRIPYKGAMPPRAHDEVMRSEAAGLLRSSGAVPSPDIKMVLQQLPLVAPEIRAAIPLAMDGRVHILPRAREALQSAEHYTW